MFRYFPKQSSGYAELSSYLDDNVHVELDTFFENAVLKIRMLNFSVLKNVNPIVNLYYLTFTRTLEACNSSL